MVIRAIPRITAWKYTPFAYAVLVFAGLLDLYLSLHLPHVHSQRENSKAVTSFMEVSIVLAQMGIWLLAMRGASGLMRYAQKIQNTTDGKGFSDIAKSLLWLIVYIVLVPLTSTIAELSLHRPHSYALVVLHNHLPLLAMAVAVAYLYRGSHRLMGLAQPSKAARQWRLLALAGFAVVTGLFVWHFCETVPDMLQRHDQVRFALSYRMLMFTYVAPHIAVWLAGILAILNLWQYSTQVAGSIYRLLFRDLYQGIFLVFVCTFIAQLLMASAVTITTFSPGVALIYFVLLLGILGYLLIYRGVQQLIKLEAVT